MNILITGASSYVGASIYSRLREKYSVVGTYHSNKLFPELEFLDITNQKNVEEFVNSKKPDVVIHVAANPNSSWCEKNPDEAVKINQESTRYLVDSANRINAKFIFISSYAVINHKSVYAKTKIESEKIVKNTKAGYIILRPAHIVGYSPNTENDRQFNRFLRNLVEKTPAIYDTSWKFQPTYLKHITDIILKILKLNIWNEAFEVAVPELKSRYDLAKDILSPFGVDVKPENKNDNSPIFNADLSKLKKLGLPAYTYDEMIKGIVQEVKDYLKTR
ncbi:NAD(P)-dependent oxidoreductase [Candidatus Woesearchaeota archaeon]|nr:NAD(P)-dependent oxidoreductase [Candidatus Woesearchaeota archaeon]